MKKITFFLLLILTTLAFSCSNDEPVETLDGTWRLRNATAPEGASIVYTDGEVYWTFDKQTHRLNVQNNVITQGPENIFSGLSSGSYNYSVTKEGDTKILYVNGNPQGIFAYTAENLVINTAPDASGLIKVFAR
jgi:hypothetical protein